MDNMNNIKTIINERDPVDLFPFTPEDEYKNEIEEVAKTLKQDIGTEELAMEIKSVFTDSFGSVIYRFAGNRAE
ncbi:DUF1871 family protein [Lactovum odontotermitis]